MSLRQRVNKRQQLAARRLLLDAKGGLNPDAKVLIAALRKTCGVNGAAIIQPGPAGVDPYATVAAAAAREVWERMRVLLLLDDYQDVNLRDEGE